MHELNPDFDVLLLAYDIREKGEYDYFMSRWSNYSYTNVLAVAVNGYIESVPFDETEDLEMLIDEDGINAYKGNKNNAEENAFGIGLIDIPNEFLDEYEYKRVYKRTYGFSKMFEEALANVIGQLKKYRRNKRRNNRGFGK